nr:MAG TPA: hypothetical protein [Caudoviricetes sp.]
MPGPRRVLHVLRGLRGLPLRPDLARLPLVAGGGVGRLRRGR